MRWRPTKGWLIGAALLAVFTLSALLTGEESRSPAFYPSTYSSDLRGYAALYRYLEQTDRPVERWRRPLSELPRADSPALMIVAMPLLDDWVGGDSLERLSAWIEEGNTLLLILGEEYSEQRWVHRHPLVDRFGLLREESGNILGRRSAINAETWPQFLRSMEDNILWDRRRVTRAFGADDALGDGAYTVSLIDPLVRMSDPVSGLILARDPQRHSALVSWHARGKGGILLSRLASPWQNSEVWRAQNLSLVEALLAQGYGTIWFDEYHHGYRDAYSKAAALRETPILLLVAQAALFLILFFSATIPRFGPIRDPAGWQMRDAPEYIQQLGGLYLRADKLPLLIERRLKEMADRAADELVWPRQPPAATLRRLERAGLVRRRDAAQVEAALRRIELGRTPGHTEMKKLLQTIHRIEERIERRGARVR